MIISLILSIACILLVLFKFDFSSFLGNFDNFNVSPADNKSLSIVTVLLVFIIIQATISIKGQFVFAQDVGFKSHKSVEGFIEYNKKRVKPFKIHFIIRLVMYSFMTFLIFNNYFIGFYQFFVNAVAEENFIVNKIVAFLVSAVFFLAILIFLLIVFIIYILTIIAVFDGTYRISIDYCDNCKMGAVNIIIKYKERQEQYTNLDKMYSITTVSSEVKTTSSSKRLIVEHNPETSLYKEDITTTDTYSYYICRCCGEESVDKSTKYKRQKYVLNKKGKWRISG